ncbi:MAG: glycine dehydrogenase subunit 2 [Alphaproteobacteria bacterium]|nr:glycine dehydrogenase subunit 2 [Alphaproteobacteria bacterium]
MTHSTDLARVRAVPEAVPLASVNGHRGLAHEEPLLFERDNPGAVGVDLPPAPKVTPRLGTVARRGPIGLPSLSEPDVVRHYTRLSRQNAAIDTNTYPLGSCTMKHNPRLNERLARLPGLAGLHPLQPVSTVQGALELIEEVARWLRELTGIPVVAMSPGAGAHGELCGMMTIRAALDACGDAARRRVLVPESAHGTNPATAAMCGFTIDPVPDDGTGRVDLAAFVAKLGPDVAAVMITNPNTCGLYETDIAELGRKVHAAGGYLYCDGANFNAIVGRVRPGDLGIDCMHLNLHKTFSTPHGGGGPGAGPVVLSAALAEFAPLPWIVADGEGLRLVEHAGDAAARGHHPIGRLKGFHGQMGMFVRALAYMLSHGGDGLRQVSGDAVLSANYVRAALMDRMTVAFPGTCMHECLFDDRFLAGTGVTTLDFAKAMIDEGIHPMTMYFPLIVHGAFLVEPTETESKAALDELIAVMADLADAAKAGDTARFTEAPRHAPRRRLDETTAARRPVLRWTPPADTAQAAE